MKWFIWLPRLLAIAMALFLSLFALDVFQETATFLERMKDLFIHLLPALACLLFVALAWRREWLGAVCFLGAGILYTVTTTDHPDWIVLVAGPLFLVGAFYLIAWRARTR